ncbi:glutamate 5-kinase [Bacillus taeanensis]|uniref:Glutamate 5-kinase n=1 Tax=Bacillus taeanensis TaxID=273032 RepID=A0A366XWF6_9BACI|nr:glutamate 5-kinase [Bacillus taeanensis]RBW70740.1 glutamate 5-kinase [Bacillus taeanensis]
MVSEHDRKRIVIKIGSSSLTSRHGEISRRKLERLVDEVALLKDEGYEVLLVSSGAVAAGYRKLGCIERPTSLPEKQAAAAVGQGLLIEAYSELFLSHGYVASQILITRSDFSDHTRYSNARNTINVLLERGIIPIINENDTVTADRLKFGDNDTLSAKVAALVNADQLIILSDIDGLYNDDPRKNPNAKLLEEVNEITPEIEASAGEPGSSVGTGGMRSKIDAVKIAFAAGVEVFLGHAIRRNILYDGVKGEAKGTYFIQKDDAHNLDDKKQWIAFNSGPEGEVRIHDEVRRELFNEEDSFDEENSLLPSDIVEVKGEFKKGSVVRICDRKGEEIGLGVINYSSWELEKFQHEKHVLSEKIIEDGEAIHGSDIVCHEKVAVPVG